MEDKFKVHGAVTLVLQNDKGVATAFRHNNMILNGGIDFLCNAFGSSSRPAIMNYIAVGTGTTTVAATDTKLVTELLRKTCTYSHTAGTTRMALTATFNKGEATGAITEAGIFNASSSGTMLCRTVFSVVNKGASDSMTITWTVTVS